jgi:glycosyltransferase involved in cell wall biosynthesis
MLFSIIIPVYNRPDEVRELLESLVLQDYRDFEVIVVEDGSNIPCRQVVEEFRSKLTVRYCSIPNGGQGFARNHGISKSSGDYLLFFDSDCIVPAHYLSSLLRSILQRKLDAHGGPDTAEGDFSAFQKVLNYSMTSFLTTGGIRGKLKDPAKYEARGYNMGMSSRVFEAVGGFIDPNKAEDIELSLRIKKAGFRLELVEEAYVYHKRKNSWSSFLKQSFSFGRNRINVSRFHKDAVKPVHILPSLFLIGWIISFVLTTCGYKLGWLGMTVLLLWSLALIADASLKLQSFHLGVLALVSSFGQLSAYGAGFLYERVKKCFKG